MMWFVMVLLLVGVLLAYFKGVKARRAWGKPVLVACVALAVVIAGSRVLLSRQSMPRLDTRKAEKGGVEAYKTAKQLATALRPHVASPCRVFLMGEFPSAGAPGCEIKFPQWDKGLSDGLEGVRWQKLGYFGPIQHSKAADISAALKELEGKTDAVVSFYGLPADMAETSIYMLEKAPKVAAYFPQGADLDAIRRWLKDDFIQAALVNEKGNLTLYTRDKMP